MLCCRRCAIRLTSFASGVGDTNSCHNLVTMNSPHAGCVSMMFSTSLPSNMPRCSRHLARLRPRLKVPSLLAQNFHWEPVFCCYYRLGIQAWRDLWQCRAAALKSYLKRSHAAVEAVATWVVSGLLFAKRWQSGYAKTVSSAQPAEREIPAFHASTTLSSRRLHAAAAVAVLVVRLCYSAAFRVLEVIDWQSLAQRIWVY